MRFSIAARAVVGFGAGIALLSGCGGTSPPAPPVPVGSITPVHHATSSGPLLYVVAKSEVYVLAFPVGTLQATFQEKGYAACSDTKGNVFIATDSGLDEFSHGGTKPIAQLILPYTTYGCSFDPTTDTLAATSGGYVALFRHEENPAVVFSPGFASSECGYDGAGNLFVDGYASSDIFALAVQPRSKRNFYRVTLPASMSASPGQVQWDGKYITVESGVGQTNALKIYRLSVNTSDVATLEGTVSLNLTSIVPALSWIHKATYQIIVPYQLGTGSGTPGLAYWRYPAGGSPVKKFDKKFGSKSGQLLGVTLSPVGS